MAAEEAWVDVEAVAAHLGVAKQSVYRWVDAKGFPAHRVGRLLRFKLSEVDEWIESGGATDDPETAKQSTASKGTRKT
jgi:excisionase family DNA binding protein